MGLIINGGNAKSDAMEAIHAAKKDDFGISRSKIKKIPIRHLLKRITHKQLC